MKFTTEAEPKNNISGVGFSKEANENPMNPWVNAGVMVYSYSKRLLWEYVNLLPNKSDDVIHIETDGIYFDNRKLQHVQEGIDKYTGEYPIAFGNALGNVKIEHQSQGESYWLGKKCYYMYDNGDIIRIKGFPQKTIDEYGNTINLIDRSFYEDMYAGKEIKKTFSTIYKKTFGTIELSSYMMTRTAKGQMTYKEYNQYYKK